MKKLSSLLFPFLFACNPSEGVKKEHVQEDHDSTEIVIPVTETILDDPHQAIGQKIYPNGIEIVWYQKGKGAKISLGDVVDIDYKVRLKDSTIVDGNYLAKLKSIPFVVGYHMQTPGWDLAFQELRIGDFVRIKIPSKLGRGKKGFEDVIPANADNYLTVRILKKRIPSLTSGGTQMYLVHSDTFQGKRFHEKNFLLMHLLASTQKNRYFTNSYEKNKPFGVQWKDKYMNEGLRKSLKNRKKGDHLLLIVAPQDAYGTKGLGRLVGPNETIFYDIQVLEVI